jgi:hypothetical protein
MGEIGEGKGLEGKDRNGMGGEGRIQSAHASWAKGLPPP